MHAITIALSLLTQPTPTAAERLPIIDMHLHARRAAYVGDNPAPMCTPFEIMPRADRAMGS